MDCTNARKVFRNIIDDSVGLKNYIKIQERMGNRDSIKFDESFQKMFDGYYRVRRNRNWREKYFAIFEKMRNESDATFEEIIKSLKKETGGVEPSFSSKMLATLNPSKPIWDKYVLINLGKTLRGDTPEKRLENAITVYSEIEIEINEFIGSPDGVSYLNEFDITFPDYSGINPVKKVDFYLWSKREFE